MGYSVSKVPVPIHTINISGPGIVELHSDTLRITTFDNQQQPCLWNNDGLMTIKCHHRSTLAFAFGAKYSSPRPIVGSEPTVIWNFQLPVSSSLMIIRVHGGSELRIVETTLINEDLTFSVDKDSTIHFTKSCRLNIVHFGASGEATVTASDDTIVHARCICIQLHDRSKITAPIHVTDMVHGFVKEHAFVPNVHCTGEIHANYRLRSFIRPIITNITPVAAEEEEGVQVETIDVTQNTAENSDVATGSVSFTTSGDRAAPDSTPPEFVCTICMENVIRATLPCGHVYCVTCITGFSGPKAIAENRDKCPQCRQQFAGYTVLFL